MTSSSPPDDLLTDMLQILDLQSTSSSSPEQLPHSICASTSSNNSQTPDPAPAAPVIQHPRYGESRGSRKRERQSATQTRRRTQATLQTQLDRPPLSATEAATRWDDFYHTKPTLYKDRHVLRSVLPQLVSPSVASNPHAHIVPLISPKPTTCTITQHTPIDLLLVEVGCGTGSALFPLLRANPRLFALGFDLSSIAVSVAHARTEYAAGRAYIFQADASDPQTYLPQIHIRKSEGADFVTALWALSALPASARQRTAEGLAAATRVGGLVLVRDFAMGDMREQTFSNRGRQVCGKPRLYLRGDGTYAYFFERNELQQLFEQVGLVCEECEYEEREVRNRKHDLVMRRRWVRARFRRV